MVVAVVVLAVALRVLWVLLVPSKPVGDFAMYVEAAAHLVEHGRFDPEYVYMPGYVLLLAPVQALGGGFLAAKLVGAVLGGLGAGAVAGIARQLSGRRAALVAGLLCACWPAGIAVASVTGTDMPAAVLAASAAYFLWRFAGPRPWLAALLFGSFTGLAAYLRAIMVPLAALAVLVFRAHGQAWRASLRWTALACAVALLVLSPWAVRNRLRYGETFFTDSHGGLTALVGANPNTDGCYSRSLNRMFRDVTGFALLAEPHRQADRAALAVALAWTKFDPLFSLGLLASKAERLLVHERALLYWPLFRAGVLPDPDRAFFRRHQAGIEAVADHFWLAVLALALMGAGVAYARRQWAALALLPPAVVLAVLYTAIFSEPRYRMPICLLILPLAALALDWIFRTARGFYERTAPSSWKREAAFGLGLTLLVFAGAPALALAGERLRERHRFAVHECSIAGQPRFCAWRTTSGSNAPDGVPAVRGVWNGVGIALPAVAPGKPASIAAETEIELGPGDYLLHADIDCTPAWPAGDEDTRIEIRVDEQTIELPAPSAESPDGSGPLPASSRQSLRLLRTGLHHEGGKLRLRVSIDRTGAAPPPAPGRMWLSNLQLAEAKQPSSASP
jgi:4-amino-4-deoxy-L-arabinose transferase-like glycosyltransferase